MTLRSRTSAWTFAALLGALAALPIAGAFADESPNTVDNATSDDRCSNPMMGNGATGIYDRFDAFRDATGRPCPGWEYLFNLPS